MFHYLEAIGKWQNESALTLPFLCDNSCKSHSSWKSKWGERERNVYFFIIVAHVWLWCFFSEKLHTSIRLTYSSDTYIHNRRKAESFSTSCSTRWALHSQRKITWNEWLCSHSFSANAAMQFPKHHIFTQQFLNSLSMLPTACTLPSPRSC